MSLLIVCAMPQELKGICKVLKNVKKHDARLYTAPTEKGGEIILAASGVGPVNAACRVLEVNQNYDLEGVLLLGVGGALVEGMELGDMVVAERILQHDSRAVFDEGVFYMKPGEYLSSPEQAETHDPYLYTDKDLNDFCFEADKSAVAGTLVTGGEFSGTVERKLFLAGIAEGAKLVEMEAAGAAMAAERLGIPFACAKTVADRLAPEDGAGSIIEDFHITLERAIAKSAVVVRHWQETK